MIDGFPGELVFQQRMRGSSLEFVYEPESTVNSNDPTFEEKIKSAEKLRALGSFKPDNPNYVACFVPYSDEEKNLKKIPDFS